MMAKRKKKKPTAAKLPKAPDLSDAAMEALLAGFRNVVEGANEDIRNYAVKITADVTEAVASGRMDLVDQLVDQLEVLGEQNRIRIARESLLAAQRVVLAVATFAAKLTIPVPG